MPAHQCVNPLILAQFHTTKRVKGMFAVAHPLKGPLDAGAPARAPSYAGSISHNKAGEGNVRCRSPLKGAARCWRICASSVPLTEPSYSGSLPSPLFHKKKTALRGLFLWSG